MAIIEGKHYVHKSEEEAAVGYTRAAFKYGEMQQQRRRLKAVDLSDVPPQPPIPYPKVPEEKLGLQNMQGSLTKNSRINGRRGSGLKERMKLLVDNYDDEGEAAVDYLAQHSNTRRKLQQKSSTKKAETTAFVTLQTFSYMLRICSGIKKMPSPYGIIHSSFWRRLSLLDSSIA